MFRKTTTALAAAILGTAALGAHAAEITYNTYLPSPHVLNKQAMEPFAERVTKETKGAVTFKMLPGGSVAKANAALDVMRDGIVSSSLIVDLYVRKSMPMSAVISDLALIGSDTLVMSAATNEYKLIHCKQCQNEMKKSSSIAIAFVSTTPYTLMCKDEVKTLADMKGKKARATGPWAVMFKEMGMVPVNVSSGETYEAMQRGQIDCSAGADAWLKSYTLWDVAKSVIDFPMGTYHGTMLFSMNADAWASLPEAGRKSIMANLPRLVADATFGYEEEKAAARAGAGEKGVKFIKPGQDFVDAYGAYQKKEIERVIETAEKAGLKDARAVVDGYLKTVAKWEKIVADTKREKAAYIEALDREIYSKAKLQ